MSTLGTVPMRRRAGAEVIAPDGAPALVWGYTRRARHGPACFCKRSGTGHLFAPCTYEDLCWLWRDGELLPPVPTRQATRLALVVLSPVYTQGRGNREA